MEGLSKGQAVSGRWGQPQKDGKPLDTTAEEVKSFRQTLTFISVCGLVPSLVTTDRISIKEWRRFQKKKDWVFCIPSTWWLRAPLDLEFCSKYDIVILSSKEARRI